MTMAYALTPKRQESMVKYLFCGSVSRDSAPESELPTASSGEDRPVAEIALVEVLRHSHHERVLDLIDSSEDGVISSSSLDKIARALDREEPECSYPVALAALELEKLRITRAGKDEAGSDYQILQHFAQTDVSTALGVACRLSDPEERIAALCRIADSVLGREWSFLRQPHNAPKATGWPGSRD